VVTEGAAGVGGPVIMPDLLAEKSLKYASEAV